jgi:hypothetical protein
LQGICSSTLRLHALRLAYTANSTLARFRYYISDGCSGAKTMQRGIKF